MHSRSAANPLDGFTVERESIRTIGTGLQRPECILAERDGTLWAADARGGVTRLRHDGTQDFIGQRADSRFGAALATDAHDLEAKFTQGTLPTAWRLPRTATSSSPTSARICSK